MFTTSFSLQIEVKKLSTLSRSKFLKSFNINGNWENCHTS